MVNWNTNSVKRRSGLARCHCGAWYDPTFGKNHCPPKRFYVSLFAAIIVLFLSVMRVIDASAQTTPVEPGPAPECYWIDGQWLCISHIEAPTPFVPSATPTATPPPVAPTVTPTPTIVIQPHPTATPTQPAHIVYFPLINR
jgi:hypothetical protein